MGVGFNPASYPRTDALHEDGGLATGVFLASVSHQPFQYHKVLISGRNGYTGIPSSGYFGAEVDKHLDQIEASGCENEALLCLGSHGFEI